MEGFFSCRGALIFTFPCPILLEAELRTFAFHVKMCYNNNKLSFIRTDGSVSMYDELTEVDIRKMREECEYRKVELRPKLIEDVKVARGFGDLSENFEYKAAKQEKNRNDSRIRYLERMIKTAKVISVGSASDRAGLFDKIVVFYEDTEETQEIRLVTTLRQNSLEGLISKESPLGKAVMGHRVGDRAKVEVSEDCTYFVEIRSIEKGEDDDTLEIRKF